MTLEHVSYVRHHRSEGGPRLEPLAGGAQEAAERSQHGYKMYHPITCSSFLPSPCPRTYIPEQVP